MMNIGYRKAALQLYGLSDVDRSWVIERLPGEQGQRLMKLISELSTMGIPVDQPWLIEALSEAEVSHQQEQDCGPVQLAELEIESADISLLKHVLDVEPDIVVAQILAYRSWTWRNAYFELCEPQRRQRIVDGKAQDSAQVSIRVIEALILGLAEKLGNSGTQEVAGDRHKNSSRVEQGRSYSFWGLLWQR